MNGELKRFQRHLLEWYDQNRRDLPWRPAARRAVSSSAAPVPLLPPPYHVFLSESMLQQTQVATVVPYFERFIRELPDFAALASADEQAVLRLWQGLGYYSRARNLRAAAQQIMSRNNGSLPRSVEELLELPGVGRYTAGAVASIAFDVKAPILDGNVVRVLCRVDRIMSDPRQPATREQLWRRAEEILPDKRVGDFNSALMELGATVCTPRAPKCMFCPAQTHCQAFAAGVQEQIPPPRPAKQRPRIVRWTFCIRDPANAWLIERRPLRGRWAGLWQFVTIEPDVLRPSSRSRALRKRLGIGISTPRELATVEHGLTHRKYEFKVFVCNAQVKKSDRAEPTPNGPSPRAWTTLPGLGDYPLSRPHLKIAELLKKHACRR